MQNKFTTTAIKAEAPVPLVIPDVPGLVKGSRFLLSRDKDGDLVVGSADGAYQGWVQVDDCDDNDVPVRWFIEVRDGIVPTDLHRFGMPSTYTNEAAALAALVAALVCKISDELYERQNALADLWCVNAAIPTKADALLAPHPHAVREFMLAQPAGMFLAEVAGRCGEGGKL